MMANIEHCTPKMVSEGARALDLWSDESLREEIDARRMAELVWKAMVPYSGMANIERTSLEEAYDDRISRLKTALRMGMPADMAINEDVRLSVAMDGLREQHRGAVEALNQVRLELAKLETIPMPDRAMAARIRVEEALSRLGWGES